MIDTAYMCFMTQVNNSSKVQFEPTLYEAEITFEKIAMAFQEVMKKYK